MNIISSSGEENKFGTNVLPAPTDLARFLAAIFERHDIIGIKPMETWTDPVTHQAQHRVLHKEIDYGYVAYFTSHPEYRAGLLLLAEAEKANLFFTVCPRFGPRNLYENVGVRLRWDYAWQIHTVRVLWSDLDYCTIEEASARCEDAGLPTPSVIVRSGHGCHLYWILDTPFLIDDAGDPHGVGTEFVTQGPGGKSLPRKYAQTDSGNVYLFLPDPETGGDSKTRNPEFNPRLSSKALYIQDILSGLAAAIRGDHTTDLSRLLRLPGTWNRKNERNGKPPVPCELIECDGSRRYPLTTFAHFASTAPSKIRREQVAQVRLPVGQKITKRLRNRLAELINNSLTAQDRSLADWALICWSIEKGLKKEDIWEEVQGIGKFAERGREYFDLTWENAEQHVRETIVQRSSGSAPAPGSSGLGGDDGLPSDPPNGSDDQPPERTPILITTDEYQVNNQAIAALSDPDTTPELFQRGNMLVRVLRDSAPQQIIFRPPGSSRIAMLAPPNLRELLTRVTQFVQRKGDEIRPAHPPDWCVSAVAARGHWSGIRHLEAVIETPTMRPDGSILSEPGWDPQTRLLFEPNAEYLAVPDMPSLTDARTAAALLFDVIVDFPFAGPPHSAVWLAAVLTALARSAFLGPCPLFFFEGNSPGAGKSLLADLIALIAIGRPMSRTAFPDHDDELRKRITSVALAGDRLMLFDNIAAAFGGSALDAALTANTWRDRLLGRSEMTPELPLHTVWFATGNNVTLKGDMPRRVVLCRLETQLERPEERTEFRHPDLVAYVHAERPRLVRAALTILRAYVVAGRPQQNLPAFGSFEGWSRMIRSAMSWATGLDPCATREGLRALDAKLGNLALLLAGWDELPNGRTGLTIAEALDHLTNFQNQYRFATLRDALMEWSRNDKLPTAAIIGIKFRSLRGQVVHGMSLHASKGHGGAQRWRVVHSDAGDGG